MSTASRRTKWHPTPPPPPSPKVLHFPLSRRTRRKQTKPAARHHHQHHPNDNPLLLMHQKYDLSYKGKLENLFDQENDDDFLNPNVERRERVEELGEEEEECGGSINGGGGFEEEKWRFQAEILRAECNFLRMEREFALKKLEKNRVKMERTLKSAVQTLVSGREKIFEGKNVNAVLEEEIEDLAEKLEELQKSSRTKQTQVRNCSNFDKKACILQRRLEKLGGLTEERCAKELQELAKSRFSINIIPDIDKQNSISNCKSDIKPTDNVEVKKMEDECNNSIFCSTASSSVASSASTSNRQLYQEQNLHEMKCSGRCKAVVRRIVEQVRAETEQWSQMQEMLKHVRAEMEQLQVSRDFWENRAHNSDYEIQSLKHDVEEWKEKALGFENKVDALELQLSVLKDDIQKSKVEYIKREQNPMVNPDLPPLSLGKQLAKEKRMFGRRLKENRHDSDKGRKEEDGRRKACKNRALRDIGNSSTLVDFVVNPESSRRGDSFRKRLVDIN